MDSTEDEVCARSPFEPGLLEEMKIHPSDFSDPGDFIVTEDLEIVDRPPGSTARDVGDEREEGLVVLDEKIDLGLLMNLGLPEESPERLALPTSLRAHFLEEVFYNSMSCKMFGSEQDDLLVEAVVGRPDVEVKID